MEFRFSYSVRPEDLWLLSMRNMYKSMAGLVNIIFTVSMGLLALRFWSDAGGFLRLGISAGILLFPLFQPLFIYLRSRKIVSRIPADLEMIINSGGISMTSGENSSLIPFSDLNSLMQIRGMLIISMNSGQTYILGRQMLEGEGQALFDFLTETMSK